MIVIQKLRYKNIMTAGNIFTEIDFRPSGTTLIVGDNGSGKCFSRNTRIRVRNEVGLVSETTIGDLYEQAKRSQRAKDSACIG